MSLTDNLANVSFSSTLETDKIVGVYEGSFNAATAPLLGGIYAYTAIAHAFTRPVFLKSQFSLDGITWSDENSSSPFEASAALGIAYSTSSNIYVVYAGTTGTIYYRVIAFWIDDFDTTNPGVPPTQGSSSNVWFDSRLNYLKIKEKDFFTVTGSSTTTTIPHNLGYEPNVRVFCESLPGEVWPATFGGTKNFWLYDFDFIECEVEVTTTSVNFDTVGSGSSPTSKIWYIIYYDA